MGDSCPALPRPIAFAVKIEMGSTKSRPFRTKERGQRPLRE